MDSSLSELKDVEEAISFFKNIFKQITLAIGKNIFGNYEVIQFTLIAFLSEGHVLLEGVPGIGKTSLVHAFSQILSLEYNRIQFTPDIMPADIIGTKIFQQKTHEVQFEKGPIFTNILLADEINRTSPKIQSALLQAMQEKEVTVGGKTYALPRPFNVIATQNPIEMEGTFPLPEAQLDRFFLKIEMDFPSEKNLIEIVKNKQKSTSVEKITSKDIARMRNIISHVKVADVLYEYAARIIINTHPNKSNIAIVKKYVEHGASPRGMQSLILGSQVRALSQGRIHVNYEDIDFICKPVLIHRIITNFQGEAEGISSFGILQKILENAKK